MRELRVKNKRVSNFEYQRKKRGKLGSNHYPPDIRVHIWLNINFQTVIFEYQLNFCSETKNYR